MESVDFDIIDLITESDPVRDYVMAEQGSRDDCWAVHSKIPLLMQGMHRVGEVKKRINIKTGMDLDFVC